MANILNNNDDLLQEKEILESTKARIETINDLVIQESIPEGFELDEYGLWFNQEKGENSPPAHKWLCSPLKVTGYTRDHKNENHGRILEFNDIDGYRHVWPMPMELLAGEKKKILEVLYKLGLDISPKKQAQALLIEYIALCKPSQKTRCVQQCGWFNDAFVLPHETIGYIKGDRIIYQNSAAPECSIDEKGSLEEWKKEISAKAIGNTRLVVCISTAFAAPLLQLLNHENIGIHLKGSSSLGKSTALHVANSVWGNPDNIRTYRATCNGLEAVAAHHNDRLLAIDELSQADPREAGQVIYMLGNGMGKARADQHGLAKKHATWHLCFLSNGEMGLSQLLGEIGKKAKAGQEVRFIEIPADTGKHGLFESLHGFEGGAAFSTFLKEKCIDCYGTAAPNFLRQLVERKEAAVDYVKTVIEGLKQRLPLSSCSQVERVFNHLAIIAAGGELASFFGITGWEKGEAVEAILKVFKEWIEARGGLGMQEEQVILDQVKSFFQQHGGSRFSPWEPASDNNARVHNRVGFFKDRDGMIEYYVPTLVFRDEICKGIEHKEAAKICEKYGILISAEDGRTHSIRLPGYKNTSRCYLFQL